MRELPNTIEAIFLDGPPERIDVDDLPVFSASRTAGGERGPEHEAVLLALGATKWNKSKAAQRLRVSRMTVYRRLAKYQLTSRPSPGAAASPHAPGTVPVEAK